MDLTPTLCNHQGLAVYQIEGLESVFVIADRRRSHPLSCSLSWSHSDPYSHSHSSTILNLRVGSVRLTRLLVCMTAIIRDHDRIAAVAVIVN
jgi:hypothetical protein